MANSKEAGASNTEQLLPVAAIYRDFVSNRRVYPFLTDPTDAQGIRSHAARRVGALDTPNATGLAKVLVRGIARDQNEQRRAASLFLFTAINIHRVDPIIAIENYVSAVHEHLDGEFPVAIRTDLRNIGDILASNIFNDEEGNAAIRAMQDLLEKKPVPRADEVLSINGQSHVFDGNGRKPEITVFDPNEETHAKVQVKNRELAAEEIEFVDGAQGRWVSASRLVERYGIDPTSLSRMVDLPYLPIRTSNSHIMPFYNINEVKSRVEERFQTEEQLWFQTIARTSFPNAVRYIRLNANQDRRKFSKQTGVSVNSLWRMETEKTKPQIEKVRAIFSSTGIDKNSKAAQLFFLKSQGIQVMTKELLEEASAESFVNYFRILKGQSITDLAAEFKKSEDTIRLLFDGKISFSTYEEQLYNWLGVERGSGLASVIHQKIATKDIRIEYSTYNKILEENYLFVDSATKFQDSYKDPVKEYLVDPAEVMVQYIEEAKTLIEAFEVLVKSKMCTKDQLDRILMFKFRSNTLQSLREGTVSMKDYTISEIMTRLGFSIHHILTQAMLSKADYDLAA